MTEVEQTEQLQLANLATLYENRLQDIVTTIKNAASQSGELASVEEADTIKNALISERESHIERLMEDNVAAKADIVRLQDALQQTERQAQERELKYQRVKQLYKAAKESQETARNQLSRYEEEKQKNEELKLEIKQLKADLQKAEENAPDNVQKQKTACELQLEQFRFEYEGKLQKERLSLERRAAELQNENEVLRQQNEELRVSAGPQEQTVLGEQIAQLQREAQIQKEQILQKDEAIAELQDNLRRLKAKRDQKERNIAVEALTYQSMANQLQSIKTEVAQLRKTAEQPFMLQNEQIAMLLAALYKYLGYSELRELISANVASYVAQREQEIKKEWADAIEEVEICVGELK